MKLILWSTFLLCAVHVCYVSMHVAYTKPSLHLMSEETEIQMLGNFSGTRQLVRKDSALEQCSVVPWWNCTAQIGTWTCPKSRLDWNYVFQLDCTLVSGLTEAQVLVSQSKRNSARDKGIGKKWIYLQRNTIHIQSEVCFRRWEAPKHGMVSLYGLCNFIG